MPFGTVTVLGMSFVEYFNLNEDGDTLTMSGQESTPPRLRGDVVQHHANIVGMGGRVAPITFTAKPERNGFYLIDSASSELFDFAGVLVKSDWKLKALRLGGSADIEFESRVPTIPRASELGAGVAPSYWHAAPVNATSYFTGATVPNMLTRSSTDGTVPVFTGLPVGVAPRWTVDALDYAKGGVDVRLDGRFVIGEHTPAVATSWSIDNGIVRVSKSATAGAIDVDMWNGAAWVAVKTYAVTVNGTSLTSTPEFTILRNDIEEAIVRLTFPGLPGRTSLDIGLRRGARFASLFIARHAAATLGLTRTAAEAATAATGGLQATAPDAQGATFIMGSSKTLTTTTATASIAKASVTRLDAFVGFTGTESNFAALVSQYLGTNGDRTRAVQR